jgi:hypothetical protein
MPMTFPRVKVSYMRTIRQAFSMMATIDHFCRTSSGRILGAAGNGVLLGVAALYLWCPVHRFPEPRPFHGDGWYNPYAAASAESWRKVNLHAHSRAWLGLTNGRGSVDDVYSHYRAMGYDVAPVSNYQAIAPVARDAVSSLTVYEQGFNIGKAHFLALSPRRVDWLDYPLVQGRDELQHRLDRLRTSSDLVILAHPRLRHALSDADLRALSGYTAMEIGSTESRGVGAWDVALDAGHPVWGMADDDTHDASLPNEAGRYWTMIAARDLDAPSIESAITAGEMYAVFGRGGSADMALDSLRVTGDTLSVAFRGQPAELTLVGSGGTILGHIEGARGARWTLPCDAPWARVVARTPHTQLFLEPILRTERGVLPRLEATIAPVPTTLRRALSVVLLLMAAAPLARGRALGRRAQPREAVPGFREAA